MGGQMAKWITYKTYMWREFNDEWYRIQTNCPVAIKKLQRRETAKEVGATTRGSTQYWRIFRVKYKKPATAKQSFKRLTGCKNNFTVRNGCFQAEIVHKSYDSNGQQVSK